ncbi:MAG TPA: hypothetical protein VMY78_00305 [Solirubrobacteraceae bacterium]|nr:hypothetical protein [Solirubrobacteraceae bacterium]
MTAQRRTAARRVAAVLGGCAAAAAALGAAAAHADTLTAGRAVTPPGVVACSHSLATSPAGGRTALLYEAGTGCGGEPTRLFARLGRGRNLGPALELENRVVPPHNVRVTTFGAQAAVAPDGGAVAAWVSRGREAGRDHLRVAIAPPGRRFGRPQTLSRVRFQAGHVPQIAVAGIVAGSRGRAVVTWSLRPRDSGVGSLRAAVRPPRGGFGRSQRLGAYSLVFDSHPSLAMAPSGAVLAAWRPGEEPSASAAVLRPRARRFGATRRISGGDSAGQVRATSGPGGAAASWSDDRRQAGTPIRIRVARLRRDGRIAAARTVASVDTAGGSLEVDGPFVAVALSGPVATWQVFRDISEAGDGRIDSTRIEATAPGSPNFASLALGGALTSTPAIGALQHRTILAWHEQIAPGRSRLRVAARPAGGGWRTPRTLAETDGAVTISASRDSALLLWQPLHPLGVRGPLQMAVYRP